MEKLPMCRICLVENVRMFFVNNRNLHELYEKLTDIPFVTEDSRPILACYFCCTKLKQCCQLLRTCLEAEELFTQMMKEDYEPKPLINQNRLEFSSGFMKSPIEHISIVDECQTESIAFKEKLSAVCDGLDGIIEPKVEHQSELDSENLENSYVDIAEITQHSESDLEDDLPLKEFKIDVEEEELFKKKLRARQTERMSVAKKPKLDRRRTTLEDAITAEQMKKQKSDSKIRTTRKRTSRPVTYFNRVKKMIQHTRTLIGEKPHKCDICQRNFRYKSYLTEHIRKHTGEKPYKCDVCQRTFSIKGFLTKHIRVHTGKKPYKCDVCQHNFSVKGNLSRHIRIHTGEKPFKCDICECNFSEKGVLTKHIRIHAGEKPFKCDVCQRSFRVKSHLSQHVLIHTGEKPYKCNVCQRSFRQMAVLRKHNRIHTLHTGDNVMVT